MDLDQIKGKAKNAFGKAEQAVGEAIGNQNLSNDGVKNQVSGAAQETWGNVKDTAHSVGETVKTKSDIHAENVRAESNEHAENLREKVANATERAKNAINEKLDSFKENEAEKREDARRAS